MLKINPSRRELSTENKRVYLRNKEFCLVEYFLKNPGRIITRTQILEEVWDRNICCPTNTVDVHMSHLRRKLRVLNCHNLLRTIPCVGYLLEPNY